MHVYRKCKHGAYMYVASETTGNFIIKEYKIIQVNFTVCKIYLRSGYITMQIKQAK